ncbi:MAG: LysR family transcriptional regulator [Gluconobacter cerinus]|uniref:LysR family transcriptional regulator n=1 Tax=Gluconobacter cerinus TaxID=38307 RepID=UPI0039E9BEFB
MAFDGRLLAGVSVLAAVVDSGSFSKAAEALGLSTSGVSRAISRLEHRVGVRLLDRSTRSVRLTAEGEDFHARVSTHLSGLEEAAAIASGTAFTVRGRLRINADGLFSRMILAPRLMEFIHRYPDIQLELLTRDEMGDLIADGVDLSVRFGPPPSSSMISRLLLHTRILVVASPAYLAAHGRPRRPEDLKSHSCILFRNPSTGGPFPWEFRRRKTLISVETKGPLLLTDVATMLEACQSGAGIAQVLELSVQKLINDGRLVELFPDWPDTTFPLYAIYPSRSHPPAKVRAFIDFCLENDDTQGQ